MYFSPCSRFSCHSNFNVDSNQCTRKNANKYTPLRLGVKFSTSISNQTLEANSEECARMSFP